MTYSTGFERKGETMNSKRVLINAIIMLSFFFTVAAYTSVMAKGHGHGPPGLQKSGHTMNRNVSPDTENRDVWIQPVPEETQRPPGWSHGKKKGWGDRDMPPGLAKKRYHNDNPDDHINDNIPAWDKDGEKPHGNGHWKKGRNKR